MKRRSAGRRLRGRVLPLFRVRCQWYGKEQHHEKIFGAEAGTARRRQLSFVRAGGNFLAAGISRLSSAGAGRERSEPSSLALWNQLSAGYNACEIVCATIVCVGIQGQKTKLLRAGIYLFAIMEWISALGYRMFPLSTSGYAGTALLLMLTGALGMKLVPADFFGVVERFSVFAATGFNAALGVHLFCAKPETESRSR